MKKQPNVIVVVLDTQRAERMSLYGYGKDTTPVTGEFSRSATTFDWAISAAPWTIPSHAAMFTGQYGTVHQTNQSYAQLPAQIPTMAELVQSAGYETVGFCNNPLVGVLDNGLRRGFDEFYNYSGTFPDIPAIRKEDAFKRFQHWFRRALQTISVPIEREFGRSGPLLRFAMQPWFVPIWTRLGSFKGDTSKSLRDVSDFFSYQRRSRPEKPLFMFVNMMEAHLPYYPPASILHKWVPYLRKDREARDFLQQFNLESYRWVAPMIEPFTEMQQQVLRDVYDAEIAYQDQELDRLVTAIRKSGELDNTMLIVTSDHGEGHGEHGFMGHAFVMYNELVHVPLVVHYPEMFPAGQHVDHAVSTRRIFHTVLEAAGVQHETFGASASEFSLTRALTGRQGEHPGERVISEAFPPLNFIRVMEMNNPDAIQRFGVREMRRVIYNSHTKLGIRDGKPDEFFDIRADYYENSNLIDQPVGYENELIRLQQEIENFVPVLEAWRDGAGVGKQVDYSSNPEILERLRGLGYIE